MRKAAATVTALLVAGGLGYAAYRWHKLSGYPKGFRTVFLGDSPEDVVRKMGRPDNVRSRPDWLWCTNQECEQEFMYGQSIPPVWWVIGFNSEGRAVWMSKLDSP